MIHPSIRSLALAVGQLRERDRPPTIIYCHGCFDLLHVGHVLHLQEAAEIDPAGRLVVTVTPDRYVGKGDGRPFVPDGDRAEMLFALACVSMVAINEWPTAVEAINLIKPDYFVKGHEFLTDKTPMLLAEEAAVASYGGQMHFTYPSDRSTTRIVEKIRGARQ